MPFDITDIKLRIISGPSIKYDICYRLVGWLSLIKSPILAVHNMDAIFLQYGDEVYR